MNIAASYMPLFEDTHALIARLDVFCSLAFVSYSAPYPYVKPDLMPLGEGMEEREEGERREGEATEKGERGTRTEDERRKI
jgi:hypothetical protein